MTDNNGYGGGPPTTLPPLSVVDESGQTEDAWHPTDYRFDKHVPGPQPTERPHPVPVSAQIPGEPLANLTLDDITRHFAMLAERIRLSSTPQPIPWEYRGPIFQRSTGGIVYLAPVPSGEIWEIERVTIVGAGAAIWKIYDSNLDDTALVAWSETSVAIYIEDASPIIRLANGSRLAVTGDGTTDFSVRVQYRLVRIPPSPAKSNTQMRLP